MENKKRKITHYRGISLNNLSNDYDIDLTGEHEKVNKTGGKAKFVSGFNKNEKRRGAPAEITPLSYLLNQPAIANTSNPAPCPFEYIASVASREVKKAEEAQVEGAGAVDNSEDSEQQRVCRTEKSLYFLCKKFISRCRQIQEQQENTSVGTPVAMKELTTYLQVEKRRIHDIVNILSTITMVTNQRLLTLPCIPFI